MSDRLLACITLDLENDWYFNEPEFDHLTLNRLDDYIALINEVDIPLSVFAVGKTIESYPEKVDQLAEETRSEFHLHSYSHRKVSNADFPSELRQGVAAFEGHFGEHPDGYRAPQGHITERQLRILDREEFLFDSSIFPSYRPGVYNNISAPIGPFAPEGTENLIEFPIATLPGVRVPIGQSYLKLFGRPLVAAIKHWPLPDTIVFDSHLQDFYRTNSHQHLPQPLRFIHQRNLSRSTELFRWFVEHLRGRGYQFVTMMDLLKRSQA